MINLVSQLGYGTYGLCKAGDVAVGAIAVLG